MKLEVVYEDDNIVAFSKPSGLLSIPDRYNAEIPNLYKMASEKYEKLFIVHRLDRDTSGIICFAKNEDSHKYMSQLFEGREIEKYYTALVQGRLVEASGNIELGIMENPAKKGTMMVHKRGKQAHTKYETLQQWNGYTLLKIQIHTGRTHQIRVHMQHLGHPVVADLFYGNGKGLYVSSLKKNFKNSDALGDEKPLLARLALHAAELKFTDLNGKSIQITAELPKDMRAAINQLNKWG